MAETKRRLPLWMLKQKTETKAQDPDANLKSEEKSKENNEEKPMKRKQRRKAPNQDSDEFDKAEAASQRCQTRQRNCRAKRKDEMEIGDDNEGHGKGVKRKSAQKRRLEISDDEVDLTVDDLVSIAEEYVNADKEKQKENSSTATATTENNPIKDASKPVQAHCLTKGLFKCTTSKPNSNSGDLAINEKINPAGETNMPSNFEKTGDAAQDMLDLFLGPLLKKSPSGKESVIEPVGVFGTSLGETSHKAETSEKAVYREEKKAGEEKEPLAKKKSSLKDKVAMFLN